MRHRITICCVAFLIGSSAILHSVNQDFKEFLDNNLAFAVQYYQIEFKNLYTQWTGAVPPQIVVQNRKDWAQFSLVCDAMLLDRKSSIQLFKDYLKLLQQEREEIKKRTQVNRKVRMNEMFVLPDEVRSALNRLSMQLKNTWADDERALFQLIENYAEPVAELRALRRIELNEDQRGQLLPSAKQLVTKAPSWKLWLQPSEEIEKVMTPYQKAKSVFIELTKQTLDAEEEASWQTRCKAFQQDIDRERKWMIEYKQKMEQEAAKNKAQKNTITAA